MVGRVAALLALLAALALYYAFHDRLWSASTWWDIAFISLVVMPACFGLVWLMLPLQRGRGLVAVGVGFGVLAWAFHVAGWNTAENFCKLFGITFVGFAFLPYFETLSWVVFVALIIPWVDAYSVWRGLLGGVPDPGREVGREPGLTRPDVLRPLPGGDGSVPPPAGLDVAADGVVVRCHARARGLAPPERAAGAATAGARVSARQRRSDLDTTPSRC